MRCPNCGFENLEGMKFCGRCATPFSLRCPHCSFENPPGYVFCGQCATPLTSPPSSGPQSAPVAGRQQSKAKFRPSKQTAKNKSQSRAKPRALRTQRSPQVAGREAPAAERRQLTVMFCDLVGSTALSERLDPEELREVVQAYHQVSAEAISRFEGQVAQHLGDGLLVYFSYPQAHEDDAQRAVRAGLGIVVAIQHAPFLQRYGVQVRLGIHTGPVVVGEIGGGDKREQLALGETPNIAARVQALAEPDTVVISAATYRLIERFFACRNLGPSRLKGISTPVTVYQVLEESGLQGHLEVAVTQGLTPLVGREQEVGLLLERWELVKEGQGQVVLLSGEAGIGKSRLVQTLKERAAEELHTRLECYCSPYYQNSALYPVTEHLQRFLRFSQDDSSQQKLSKLEGALEHYGFALPEVTPLFAALLSLPLPERYPPLLLTPQRQKQKTLEALLAWLLAEAQRQPVLFVWEDLQWADPSTLEFINLLIDIDQGPTARLLTLLTFRPDFTPSWTMRSHLTQIMLSRLSHKQVEVIVEKLIGGKSLPTDVLQQLVVKTDGVPLFVEELTKMVLESGLLREQESRYELTGPLPPLAIPATLHDSLTARLDRLAVVKEVAQLGATLGREFSYDLLHAVSPLDERTLQKELGRLVEAELLFQRGLLPQARYIFKHALIQDAAYQSLLKSTRQQYHQQIARVLEERFPKTAEIQPELLAHHYTEAGLIGQALPYWQRAGQRASQHSANVEAIHHLTKGLELLKTLPETPKRIQQELALQIALAVPLIATRGHGAPEVGQAYTRARELCRQGGETPQLFPVLMGLRFFYTMRGELPAAREIGEQLLQLAQREQDPALLVEAYYALGILLYCLGEFAAARAHFEQSLALYDPQQHHARAFLYGVDPGVICISIEALALWYLGYPDQASRRSHKVVTLAQELSHPYSLAYALNFSGILHYFLRDVYAVKERVEALLPLSQEQEFPMWVGFGTALWGWVLAEQGQMEEGLTQMRQGVAAYQATGAEVWRPYFFALLAEGCGRVKRVEEGLTLVAEALVLVRNRGERFCEAELYRLRGELTLAQSSVQSLESSVQKEAEACFLKAIEIARQQQAKSLELRAVMSLVRLRQQQATRDVSCNTQHDARGTLDDARTMLSAIYNWFTEGFDTKDLQEAKVLLEKLTTG